MTAVVLVGPGYPPDTGGVETHLRELARGLTARGVDVQVWVPGGAGPGSVRWADDGVLVRRFPSSRSHRFPMSPALWWHARRHWPEGAILHVHSYHNTAALAALAAPRDVPVVFTPHYHGGGHTRLAEIAHVPYRALGRRLVARAHTVVAVTAAEQALLERDFPDSSGRVRVSHNGADVAAIHAAAPRPGEPPTLLVSGRLETYKRVDDVIAAFARVTGPAQLVITGDGPDRPRLEALALQSARAADVRLLGRVGDDDLRSWQRTAVGVVSMSEHEAFGIVAVEMAAAGGRAVLSDIAAHREVAALVGTDVVSITAADGLTGAMQRLVDDPAPGVPRTVRDWSDQVDEHTWIYRDVMAGSRAASPDHQRR